MTARNAPTLSWAGASWLILLTALILGLGAAVNVVALRTVGTDLGQDFLFYRDVGARWLAGEGFYAARQLEPYDLRLMVDNLYPPNALMLFVPAALLPLPLAALAWWAIPLGVIGYQLHRMRPAMWAWPILALLAAWPRTGGAVIFGNTDLWIAAAVAGGTLWGWPALLVAIKPTFAPLALVGVRRRSWWIGAALGLGFVLLTLPDWLRYPEVIRNAGNLGLDYSFGALPFALLPLVAYYSRRTASQRIVSATSAS